MTDNTKNASTQGAFYNIRAEAKFSAISNEMLKMIDMMAQRNNAPQPSYEAHAMQEYQQNSANYVHASKVTGQKPMGGQMMGGQSGFYGQQQ